eukprot:4793507-Pyramimonas_sp.AAC.1
MLDEVQTAATRGDSRVCFQVLRKLAPRPAAPTVTVRNPATGNLCWSAEEEQEVRARALADIFQGALIAMDEPGGPQVTNDAVDDSRISPFTVAEVRKAFERLPNHKAGPVLKEHPPPAADNPRGASEGAVAEIWKLALRSDALADAVTGAFQACQGSGRTAQRFKNGETVSLRKPKGDGSSARDHYRTINLIGHAGKAYTNVTCMPALKQLGPK